MASSSCNGGVVGAQFHQTTDRKRRELWLAPSRWSCARTLATITVASRQHFGVQIEQALASLTAHQLGGLEVLLALATITVASRQHSDMSDRKIRWAPRLEPGDHISGCDYLGLRELDSSSADTLLQLPVRWSGPCTGHHQSCPVQPALATPANLLGALRTGNTQNVALCLAHWQRLCLC